MSGWPRERRRPAPVPLPPWWERHPRVLVGEMRELQRLNKSEHRPALRARFGPWDASKPGSDDNPIRLIVEGTVRVRAARAGEAESWHSMRVEIGYPPTFPSDHPDVRPKDPTLARRRHQMGRSREFCYVDEARLAWRPGRGLEQALDGARAWLRGEVTGEWPGEVPASELHAYFDESAAGARVVLIPAHSRRSPDTVTHGMLDLEVSTEASGPAVVGALHARGPGRRASPAMTRSSEARATNDQLWEALRARRREAPVRGLWFRLEREPQPFHDFAGLEGQLLSAAGVGPDAFARLLSGVLDPSSAHRGWVPVALEYPSRAAPGGGPETEWLFITLEWTLARARGTSGSQGLRRAASRNPRLVPRDQIEVRALPAHDVTPGALRRRTGDLYRVEPLETAHVVIIGVGALGSTVARALAAAGVRYFTLVDPDVFKPGNAVRHELRFPDVGRGKAQAMRRVIIETNPYAEVTVVAGGTRADDRAFERLVLHGERRPSLIISLTAVKAVEGQADALAAAASLTGPQIPVLHGWVYPHAQFLRAFLYRPGRTACTWCTELYRMDAEEGDGGAYMLPPTPTDAEAAAPFYEGGCGSPTHPGAGVATLVAAGVLAEHALSCLEPGRVRDEETHWLFAGARVRDVDPRYGMEPLSQRTQGFAPHPDCHLCSRGTLDVALDAAERAEYDAALAALRRPAADGAEPPRGAGRLDERTAGPGDARAGDPRERSGPARRSDRRGTTRVPRRAVGRA